MKNWFISRIAQKSTWYGIGAVAAAVAGNKGVTPDLVAAVLAGLGLVTVDG